MSQDDENYAELYKATREYALKIGNDLFPDLDQSRYRHSSENAATTVLLTFDEKFKSEKASFSTWAYQSIRADLLEWKRKKFSIFRGEVGYAEYVSIIRPPQISAEDKLLADQILSNLSQDERDLLHDKLRGTSIESMAYRREVSIATIKRRWDAVLAKAREVAVPQGKGH